MPMSPVSVCLAGYLVWPDWYYFAKKPKFVLSLTSMAIYRNTRFTTAQMLVVLFSLSSCGFAYKPTAGGTSRNKMMYSIPVVGHGLDITAGVANKKDTGAFDVIVGIRPVRPKDNLTVNWLRLTLVDRNRHAQPYVLKAVSFFREDDWGKPIPEPSDTAIAGLLDTATYLLNYHFAGVNKRPVGHALRIGLSASFTQAEKTTEVNQAIDYKRFFWLDIAGN